MVIAAAVAAGGGAAGVRVIDGDTLEVDGETIRLVGNICAAVGMAAPFFKAIAACPPALAVAG